MISLNWQSIFFLLILLVSPVVIVDLWSVARRKGKTSGRTDLTEIARKTIIDQLEGAAIILDLKGVIVEINPAAAKLCSLSQQQARGRLLSSVLSWWQEVEQRFDHCIELQEDIQIAAAGKKHHFNIQITPTWDNRQNLTGRLVMVRDTTANKLTGDTEALAAVRTELLAKVSHELRTPLTSILGITEMLDYGVYGPLSREQKEALRMISDSSRHMVRLVSDLLEQTRLESGALQLDIAEFAMEDLITRLRVNTIHEARSKGLGLIFDISQDVPTILRGDVLRLYQILRNLVDNAIKYTENGQIKVRVYRYKPEHYAFEVSDTGIGIPKDKQSLIYKPFLRIYPTAQPNGNGNKSKSNGNGNGHCNGNGDVEGFGLGLSIVKQLVTLMDGEIELFSDLGQGSTFTVRLHLEPVHEQVITNN